MLSTHRTIQIHNLLDTAQSKARQCRRAADNLASIGNLKGSQSYIERAARLDEIASTCERRLKPSRALAAAEHWESLAKSEEDMADFEDANGQPYGCTKSYRHRARIYRDTAKVLRLEAETGKPHCGYCFGDHPNHLHMHAG
jgi:hypothetical protein